MSRFAFLRREWAAVFEAASKAEAAVRADPRTDLPERLLKRALGDLDRIVHWQRVLGMVNSPPGSTASRMTAPGSARAYV